MAEEKLDIQMAELKKRKQYVDHMATSWCYAGKCGVLGCDRVSYCADCGAIALEHFPYCQPCLIRRSK